jgi:hypothetical protein
MIGGALVLAVGCGGESLDTGSPHVPRAPASHAFTPSHARGVALAGFGSWLVELPVLIGGRDNGPDAAHLTIALGETVYGPRDLEAKGTDMVLVVEDPVVRDALGDGVLDDRFVSGTRECAGSPDVASFCATLASYGARCAGSLLLPIGATALRLRRRKAAA